MGSGAVMISAFEAGSAWIMPPPLTLPVPPLPPLLPKEPLPLVLLVFVVEFVPEVVEFEPDAPDIVKPDELDELLSEPVSPLITERSVWATFTASAFFRNTTRMFPAAPG